MLPSLPSATETDITAAQWSKSSKSGLRGKDAICDLTIDLDMPQDQMYMSEFRHHIAPSNGDMTWLEPSLAGSLPSKLENNPHDEFIFPDSYPAVDKSRFVAPVSHPDFWSSSSVDGTAQFQGSMRRDHLYALPTTDTLDYEEVENATKYDVTGNAKLCDSNRLEQNHGNLSVNAHSASLSNILQDIANLCDLEFPQQIVDSDNILLDGSPFMNAQPQAEPVVFDLEDPNVNAQLEYKTNNLNHQSLNHTADTSRHESIAIPADDEDIIVISSDSDEDIQPWMNSGRRMAPVAGDVFGRTGDDSHLMSVPVSNSFQRTEEEYDKNALRKLVENNNLSADATEEAPNCPELEVELMRHQKRAVAWMVKRETTGADPVVDINNTDHSALSRDCDSEDENAIALASGSDGPCLGGILADEQGLGKTLSVIGLFLSNRCVSSDSSLVYMRTLIVCPVSLVTQWRDEITSKVRSRYSPKIYIYHGSKRISDPEELSLFDVVITTYATITNEYPKLLRDDPTFAERKKQKLPLPRRMCGPLYQCHWDRVVLDEAHHIKNRRTGAWAAAVHLPAVRRWCLTGTPIQNSVDDIYSLFCFIRYRFLASNKYEVWNQIWKKKLESSNGSVRTRAFKRFQAIVGVVTLRRTKLDNIDGKPLIMLPDRECCVQETHFRQPEELVFYQALEQNSLVELEKFMSQGGLRHNYSGIMVLLLRLRQACCHPSLITYAARKGLRLTKEEEDINFACPFTSEELTKTQELMEAGASVMQFLTPSAQESVIPRFRPKLLNTLDSSEEQFSCDQCEKDEQPSRLQVHPNGTIYCEGCVSRYLELECGGSVENDPFVSLNDIRREICVKARLENNFENGSIAEVGQTRSDCGSMSADLTPPRKRARNDKGSTNGSDDSSNGEPASPAGVETPSTKILLILDVLNAMRARSVDEKCLIFSQWTSMLDIIGIHLTRSDFSFCRLDGTMSMQKRREEIARFKTDKTISVFLISMHAGGTGLNLTEANNVILADCWFNPSVEEQCCDRAHRIGQRSKVRVTRMKIIGTVEEKIYDMCRRKSETCKAALGENGSSTLGRQKMTLEDALELFGNAAENVARNANAGASARQAAMDIGRLLCSDV